jgi:hypothetical protein
MPDHPPAPFSTRIIIEAVPPEKMRLESYREVGCGDWFVDPETGDIRIVIAGPDVWDDEKTFLIALHELVEARLCTKDGVTQGAVDTFDANFTGDGEPGDDPKAPYQRQHRAAMMIEHMMALFFGRWSYGKVE